MEYKGPFSRDSLGGALHWGLDWAGGQQIGDGRFGMRGWENGMGGGRPEASLHKITANFTGAPNPRSLIDQFPLHSDVINADCIRIKAAAGV